MCLNIKYFTTSHYPNTRITTENITYGRQLQCGGMFGLYVNKYLKFLKCFDISLQSSRNIHQNRIVMLRNVYVCATELSFNSSRMPAVRELFRNLCL